jgi:hypothetical protein
VSPAATIRSFALVVCAALPLEACGPQTLTFGGDAAGDVAVRADADADAKAPVDEADGGCPDCILDSLHCDPGSRQCVACFMDSQCPPLKALCNQSSLRCVECEHPGEPCQDPGFVCSPTFDCAPACVTDGDCPPTGEQYCDVPLGICVECVYPQQCGGGRGPTQAEFVCDSAIGKCAECTSAIPCPRNLFCDPMSDRCVGCLSMMDCRPGEVCDPNDLGCVGPDAGVAPTDAADEFGFH